MCLTGALCLSAHRGLDRTGHTETRWLRLDSLPRTLPPQRLQPGSASRESFAAKSDPMVMQRPPCASSRNSVDAKRFFRRSAAVAGPLLLRSHGSAKEPSRCSQESTGQVDHEGRKHKVAKLKHKPPPGAKSGKAVVEASLRFQAPSQLTKAFARDFTTSDLGHCAA